MPCYSAVPPFIFQLGILLQFLCVLSLVGLSCYLQTCLLVYFCCCYCYCSYKFNFYCFRYYSCCCLYEAIFLYVECPMRNVVLLMASPKDSQLVFRIYASCTFMPNVFSMYYVHLRIGLPLLSGTTLLVTVQLPPPPMVVALGMAKVYYSPRHQVVLESIFSSVQVPYYVSIFHLSDQCILKTFL